MLRAKVSLDIATADFKAMLVPRPPRRRAPSIVEVFRKLAEDGVEIRLLHSGTPSEADRKSTRLNSSHLVISYAVFCLKKTKAYSSPCRPGQRSPGVLWCGVCSARH